VALGQAMNQNQVLFLRQANSDFQMFELLQPMVNRGAVEPCHGLHYLQMATEKLAKAYFLGHAPIKKTHTYFSKFWRALRTRQRIRRALGYADSESFRNDLLMVAGLATAIEELAPALADEGPNTEYPWPAPDYTDAPASFHFKVWGRINHGQDGVVLLKLVRGLFRVAPTSF
jgi:hypothetical protein